MNTSLRAGCRRGARAALRSLPLLLALTACASESSLLSPLDGAAPVHEEALARWAEAAPSPAPPRPAETGVPTAATTPAPPPAPVPIPLLIADPTPRVLQLRGAQLGEALQLIAGMGNVNLVLVGDFSRPVDLDLPDLPLQAAFELLVRTYDCDVEPAGAVTVVRREDPGQVDTRVFTLKSIAAAMVQPQLAPLVGDGALVVNAARNVIMVTAPQSRLHQIEAYLDAVDRPDRQVLIEARILEVSRKRLEELGTRIAFNDISVGDGTATLVSSLLTENQQVLGTIASSSGSFDAAINALRQLTGLEVLSRPRLLAINNHEAKLDIVTEIPYVNATTTTQGSTASVGQQTIQTIEYKNVGLKLVVVPTVMEGGLIGLNIDQEVSDQTGEFDGVPIVDSRHITTAFQVHQGETIMIGGLLQDRRGDASDGVPLLMDLPLVGQAFRNNRKDDQQTELILLMTPWLVDPQSGRALIAGGEAGPGALPVARDDAAR